MQMIYPILVSNSHDTKSFIFFDLVSWVFAYLTKVCASNVTRDKLVTRQFPQLKNTQKLIQLFQRSLRIRRDQKIYKLYQHVSLPSARVLTVSTCHYRQKSYTLGIPLRINTSVWSNHEYSGLGWKWIPCFNAEERHHQSPCFCQYIGQMYS